MLEGIAQGNSSGLSAQLYFSRQALEAHRHWPVYYRTVRALLLTKVAIRTSLRQQAESKLNGASQCGTVVNGTRLSILQPSLPCRHLQSGAYSWHSAQCTAASSLCLHSNDAWRRHGLLQASSMICCVDMAVIEPPSIKLSYPYCLDWDS